MMTRTVALTDLEALLRDAVGGAATDSAAATLVSSQRVVHVRQTTAGVVVEAAWAIDDVTVVCLGFGADGIAISDPLSIREVARVTAVDVGSTSDGATVIVRAADEDLAAWWRYAAAQSSDAPVSPSDLPRLIATGVLDDGGQPLSPPPAFTLRLDPGERLEIAVHEPGLSIDDRPRVVASLLFVGQAGHRVLVAPGTFPDSTDLALARFPDGEIEALLLEVMGGSTPALRMSPIAACLLGALREAERAVSNMAGASAEAVSVDETDTATESVWDTEMPAAAWAELVNGSLPAAERDGPELRTAVVLGRDPLVHVRVTSTTPRDGHLQRRTRVAHLSRDRFLAIDECGSGARIRLAPIRSLVAWLVDATGIAPVGSPDEPAALTGEAARALIAAATLGVDVECLDWSTGAIGEGRTRAFAGSVDGSLHLLGTEGVEPTATPISGAAALAAIIACLTDTD